MEPDEINRKRRETKEEGGRDYSLIAKQAKRRRDKDEIRTQSKVQRILNWW